MKNKNQHSNTDVDKEEAILEDIIRMGDVNRASDWEYLGTVVQNGMEFVALQPLDGTSRVSFFLCDAGQYCRVADAETERAVSRQFRQAAMEDARDRSREAR